MKNYSLKSIEAFISKYINEWGGEMHIVEEGCLGLGTIILTNAPNKKTIIIKEYFINEWSCGHTVKASHYYNLPDKYLLQIQKT